MKKILAVIILVALFFSCSSDLDFNQVNDLKREPILVTNLGSFDAPAQLFTTGITESAVTTNFPIIKIFEDLYFKESLVKAEFFFEFNNTINSAFEIKLIFLDASGTKIDSILFDVPAYSGLPNVVRKTETFDGPHFELLKTATKITFVVKMLGSPLAIGSPGSLKLRSSATIY